MQLFEYERIEKMFVRHVIGGGQVELLVLNPHYGPIPFGMTSGILRLESTSTVQDFKVIYVCWRSWKFSSHLQARIMAVCI